MVQQVFDLLFVLTLVVPVAAVILGLLSLALPARRQHAGHSLGTAVQAKPL